MELCPRVYSTLWVCVCSSFLEAYFVWERGAVGWGDGRPQVGVWADRWAADEGWRARCGGNAVTQRASGLLQSSGAWQHVAASSRLPLASLSRRPRIRLVLSSPTSSQSSPTARRRCQTFIAFFHLFTRTQPALETQFFFFLFLSFHILIFWSSTRLFSADNCSFLKYFFKNCLLSYHGSFSSATTPRVTHTQIDRYTIVFLLNDERFFFFNSCTFLTF